MFGTLVPTFVVVGWSGSGGDAFPFYFRETGLGPRMAGAAEGAGAAAVREADAGRAVRSPACPWHNYL